MQRDDGPRAGGPKKSHGFDIVKRLEAPGIQYGRSSHSKQEITFAHNIDLEN